MSIETVMAEYEEMGRQVTEMTHTIDRFKEDKTRLARELHKETDGKPFEYMGNRYRAMNQSDGKCYVKLNPEKNGKAPAANTKQG